MKNLSFLKKITYWFLLLSLFLVSGLIAISLFNIPGSYKFFIVQSGSMEPSIKRLGIVVTKPSTSYIIGDVVTAKDLSNPKITLTHRIVNIEQKEGWYAYTTKGDANDAPDSKTISEDLILGKVIFSLPYIGYPIVFAKTIPGFIILIIVPALIIAFKEIITIIQEVKKRQTKPSKSLISSLLILVSFLGLISAKVSNTNSYLVDRETTMGNTFTAKFPPELSMRFIDDHKNIIFIVKNIADFKKISYELTYDCDSGKQGVLGTASLTGESEFTRTITLGTCTTGRTCTYHTGVVNIKLHVDLEDKDGNITSLDNSL